MSLKNPLKKFQKGVLGIIAEIVTSFIFGFLLTSFAKDQVIGADAVVIFTLIGFIGSVGLMFSFKSRGFVFLTGWILSAWLLRGLFNPFYFVVYLVAPVVAIVLKSYWLFRRKTRRLRIL